MITLLLACTNDPTPPVETPLGMPLLEDGVTYAGAAAVDLTPVILETWTDLDGDHTFDGCNDDPDCVEPFDDVDGDGWFDAVWIGGFGPMRPAVAVHDPIWARAMIVARDGEYVALVSLDLVGLGHPRIWQARDALVADGFDPERLIVSSTHNHQGPDTMGLWGNPLVAIPGFDEAYQQRVARAIEQAVREAAAGMEPVALTVGKVAMRARGPWFNGPEFGGKNPDRRFHGMIHDGRDPIVISDQVLALQAKAADHVVFTMTSWSGHPEVRDSENNEISSDWVGVTRNVLEARFGGVAIHLPESLGGMMSALNGDLPLVLEDGTHVFQTCDAVAVADATNADCFGRAVGSDRIDADGDIVPVWSVRNSWEFVTSHGWHIAEAAIDALADGEVIEPAPLKVAREPFLLPITNFAYNLFGPTGLFDMDIDRIVTDPARCPEVAPPDVLGCFEAHVFRLELGPVGFLSIPGELLPELAWGFPEEDPRWQAEVADPAARGPEATYFPQHPAACLALDSYETCRTEISVGDCDCLAIHAWPYRLSDDASQRPLLAHLDTGYKAMIGMADSYFSYVIPEPDFNHHVSLLTDDGDHYEDTVSAASVFAERLFDAHQRLADRW